MTNLEPSSLEQNLPWIRKVSQGFARRWPSIDPVELEGRVIEWWLEHGKAPRVDWMAKQLLEQTRSRQDREERWSKALTPIIAVGSSVPERLLPIPPEDKSQISLDAFVLECRATNWSEKDIAAALGSKPRTVRARLARLSRDKNLRQSKRNWRGERISKL